MVNPILVELTRGDLVESVHRGAAAVVRSDGTILFSTGDIEALAYPRSSLKPVQALPLLESGAADAFALRDEEIALACASHSGEPMHTNRVSQWLARIGCTASDLACGPHPSRYEPVAEAMIRSGEEPTTVHNNCSGKHTGFLTVARHWGIATAGYERHDHPVQQAVQAALAELGGLEPPLAWGVDGCTAPNFAVPLRHMALALSRMADYGSLPDGRRVACQRIIRAMTAFPELVSGTGRSDSILMRAANGRVATKVGAEAFYVAMVPDLKLGIALKIDDGTGRAAETAMAALLLHLGLIESGGPARNLILAPITNTRGQKVGERRASPALSVFQRLG